MSENIEFKIRRATHYRNINLPVWRVERKDSGLLLGEFNDKGDLRLVDRLTKKDSDHLTEEVGKIIKTLI